MDYKELAEIYKNERDTYKRLAKSLIKQNNKLEDRNKEIYQGFIATVEEVCEANKEIERLNDIIKNLDKMFEYYFLSNLKYDQDTVNTIYIKYVELKELKGSDK